MNNGKKIIFIGSMGAGKTTAISSISDDPPVTTEAMNSARHISDKQTTTVAMDFGRIYLDQFDAIDLYGIPGQDHFDFLWPILEKGALGAIFLLDCSQGDIPETLDRFCNAFARLRDNNAIVIALNRTDQHSVQRCQQWLFDNNLTLPVIVSDPRERTDVLMLLELLIANVEAELFSAGETQ